MKRRVTGGWLVRDKQCTASCLIASGNEIHGCTCICGGVWHGALADVEIVEQRVRKERGEEGAQMALIGVDEL